MDTWECFSSKWNKFCIIGTNKHLLCVQQEATSAGAEKACRKGWSAVGGMSFRKEEESLWADAEVALEISPCAPSSYRMYWALRLSHILLFIFVWTLYIFPCIQFLFLTLTESCWLDSPITLWVLRAVSAALCRVRKAERRRMSPTLCFWVESSLMTMQMGRDGLSFILSFSLS